MYTIFNKKICFVKNINYFSNSKNKFLMNKKIPKKLFRICGPSFRLKVVVSAPTRCLLEAVLHSKSRDIFVIFFVRPQRSERVQTTRASALQPTHGTQYGDLTYGKVTHLEPIRTHCRLAGANTNSFTSG